MKNIKFVLKYSFIVVLLLVSQISYAEGENINLTIKNNGNVVYSGSLALPGQGTVDINDADGNPHSIDARSVLDIINMADVASSDFKISNLIYYSSFKAFYLKCITIAGPTELCDNWQYKVNDTDPGVGMDQDILAGGETVVLFFGDENAVSKPVDPAPPVEPAPVNEGSYHSSGGSYTTPQPTNPPLTVNTPVAPAPITQPVVVEVPKPNPLPVNNIEIPKTTPVVIKKIEKKVIPKIAKVNNSSNSSQITANVVSTTNDTSPVPAKKESWIKSFFKWLFGF